MRTQLYLIDVAPPWQHTLPELDDAVTEWSTEHLTHRDPVLKHPSGIIPAFGGEMAFPREPEPALFKEHQKAMPARSERPALGRYKLYARRERGGLLAACNTLASTALASFCWQRATEGRHLL